MHWPPGLQLQSSMQLTSTTLCHPGQLCAIGTHITFLPVTTYQHTPAVHTLMSCGSVVLYHH